MSTLKVLFENKFSLHVPIKNLNITVEEFISNCKQFYKEQKGKEIEELEDGWERRLFSRGKGIWLQNDKEIGIYMLDNSDILEFTIKPKLLHLCLGYVRKCGVFRYYPETTVEDILKQIPLKAPALCILDDIIQYLGLYLLQGESNKKIIEEAQKHQSKVREEIITENNEEEEEDEEEDNTEFYLNLSCHEDDDDWELDELNTRQEEQNLLENIFSSKEFAKLITNHSETCEIQHIHPLDLINDGLNYNEGIWLDIKQTLNSYKIDKNNDIVILCINPSLCSLESRVIDNFITVFNPEISSTKRKKFSFDTTVEEYVKQLCKTFQLNPHQKEFALFSPPVNDQEGSWLVPGSNLISSALNKNKPIEFRRKENLSTSPTTIGESIHVLCLLDENSKSFFSIQDLKEKKSLEDNKNLCFSISYDLDTLGKLYFNYFLFFVFLMLFFTSY